MKRALLTTTSVVAFALATALSAQTGTYGGSTQESQSTAEKGTKETTVTGCIEQSGSEYMLKTKKGNAELETTEDLKPHVGHTVKVHGSWDKAADKSEAAGGSHDTSAGHQESAEHKGMKEHHFKVSSVEMVSEQCTVQSSAK
jgi:hypothetical protein